MTAAIALLPDALDTLRLQMDEVVAAGRNPGPSLSTGMAALDRKLGGGIPRGRVTEITGAMGAGKTALLRQVVSRALAQGQWVAWIDTRRSLAPGPWAGLGKRFVVVRPNDVKRAAWCADLLLRSGVFSLVVLDDAPIVSRSVGYRLAQIARERDAAFVVISQEEKATRISGTLRLRVSPCRVTTTPLGRRTTAVTISSLKPGFSFEVDRAAPSPLACSLCAHPAIPDRRGVARGPRRSWNFETETDPQRQHAVSWGGLGVSIDHDHGRPGTARPAIRSDARPVDNTPRSKKPNALDVERLQRQTDRVAQYWSHGRGRRRAAESTWGRPTRRERAREHTGAPLESHLGQGWGKLIGKGRVEPKPRPQLGRVAEGVG